MIGKAECNYSIFTNRMLALAIDFTIISIVLMPILNYFQKFVYGNLDFYMLVQDGTNKIGFVEFLDYISTNNLIIKWFVIQIVTAVIVFGLITLSWVKFGNTPGKFIMGAKILDAKTLNPPTRRQYIIRSLSYFVSGIPFCIGFFVMNWSKNKQCFHDRIAGTVVVNVGHDFSWITSVKSYFKSWIKRKLT